MKKLLIIFILGMVFLEYSEKKNGVDKNKEGVEKVEIE